jgi:mannitol/fructose-specific phosphotransferase system IIA component (Ntr-type)
LISASDVQLNLASTTADAVLAELVNGIRQLAYQPETRETLLRALLERERLHSTGIGDGIALPHARNALIGILDRPMIGFGRHATGIEYGAIDGAPVRLFFLLVAPTVTSHLAVLARISRVLRDSKLRQELLTVDSGKKVVALIREAEAKV